jgi:hypothetical protein
VDWLPLAALGIMWVAFLVPTDRRRSSGAASVAEFERGMELLAYTDTDGAHGRWIVTPRKGVPFVGAAHRQRARARERRRRVLIVLLESIGITFLIGSVPPLRAMWSATIVLGILLFFYVWLLLAVKQRARVRSTMTVGDAAAVSATVPARPITARHVAEGAMGWARPTFNGLASFGEPDRVHVVVRPASASA